MSMVTLYPARRVLALGAETSRTFPPLAWWMRGNSIQPLPSDVAMWWSVILVVLDLIDVRPSAGLMR